MATSPIVGDKQTSPRSSWSHQLGTPAAPSGGDHYADCPQLGIGDTVISSSSMSCHQVLVWVGAAYYWRPWRWLALRGFAGALTFLGGGWWLVVAFAPAGTAGVFRLCPSG